MGRKTHARWAGSDGVAPSRPGAFGTGVLVALAAALLAACAAVPEDPVERELHLEADDPAEPANRYVFDVNLAALALAVEPVADVYADAVPEPYRKGIGNVLDNLTMPVTVLNSALQGDADNAMDASVSFFINSTAGLGGLFDIPGGFGDEPRKEDFGQTLAVWGVGDGNFINYPLFGPNSVRDTPGLVTGAMTNVLTYTPLFPLTVLEIVDTRANLDRAIELRDESAVDPYIFTREAYRQRRNFLVHDGDPPLDDFDDFDEDEDEDEEDGEN